MHTPNVNSMLFTLICSTWKEEEKKWWSCSKKVSSFLKKTIDSTLCLFYNFVFEIKYKNFAFN